MKGQTYIILAFVFALMVAIFAVINVDPVEVNYLLGTGNAPLILVILVSVLMGALIVAIVGMLKLFQMKKEIQMLHKQFGKMKQQEEELQEGEQMEEIQKKGKFYLKE